MIMKRRFSILSVIIVSCFIFSCNHNKKTKLVIYSPHGKEMLSHFEKLYEQQHPEVDIQWLDMGSQEVFDRVSTESQNPQADIWWGSPATLFMRAEKLGLLETYRPTWADQVPAAAKSKNNTWFGTFSTPEVIAFNEKMLQANLAPKNWNEVVKPEWKGKIVLRNPMASGTLRAIFCAMIALSVKETGNEERGWNWLKQLSENTRTYAADPTQMYAQMNSQQPAITLWNMPDIILQKEKYNYPFGYVFPDSGTVVLTDGIAIVKGTKHTALAKDFYEFVTNSTNLLIQAEKFHRIPSRTDLDKQQFPDWLKNCHYKVLDIDWELVAANEAEWMKKWDATIKLKNE